MPPRLSGSRVTRVGYASGGKPKPVNPGPNLAESVARRQKISKETATTRLRNLRRAGA
jgi:hypothetical protein